MTYQKLRATSWHLDFDALEPVRYQVLRYPAEWRKPLLELFKSGLRRPDSVRQVPINALNDALALLVPDLIGPADSQADWNGEDWLYAVDPIDIDGIARVVRAWVHTLGPRNPESAEHDRLLREALGVVQPGAPGWEKFTWEERTIDIAEECRVVGANGTAKPAGLIFKLLPHLLVRQLTAPGVRWNYGEAAPFEFRRAPDPDEGAAAVSWPPSRLDLPFSYLIKLQVQTQPGRPDPVIYANVGVRRWAYRRAKLPTTSYTGIHLIRSSPLIDDTGRSRAFRRIGVRWRRDRGVHWADRLQPVLDNLGLRPALPDAEDLVRHPRKYLEQASNGDALGIVFRNELGEHAVEPGLSVRERSALSDWMSDALHGWVTPDAPYERVFGPRDFATSPRSTRTALDRAQFRQKAVIKETAREAGADPAAELKALRSKYAELVRAELGVLLDSVPNEGSLTIEVHHFADSRLPEVVASTISQDLGPSTGTEAAPEWALGTGRITMNAQLIRGEHADRVVIPDRAKPDQIHAALLARATEIERSLPPATGSMTAGIVEVHERAYFSSRPLTDVKPVFRLAHARSGRITQFVHPLTGENSDQDRIGFAWRDVQRQLGVQLISPQVKIRKLPLPEQVGYLAIWIVRTNKTRRRMVGRRVPVMIYLDSSRKQRPQLVSPYFDDWLDYREGLIRLACDSRLDTESRRPENREFVHRFLTDRIRDVTALRRDTLLLTVAENLRPDWGFVGNGKLAFDYLDDQAVAGTGLRHVRVRTATEQIEVPDVWGVGADERNDWGLSGGLWHMYGDRVFSSTADKPVQAKQIRQGLSKTESTTFTPRPKNGEKQGEVTIPPAPTADVWTARMIELTAAALQPGDDPRAWAGVAHQLRWANTQYDDATTLPMPLHLAQQAGEYVLGTARTDDDQGAEDDGE